MCWGTSCVCSCSVLMPVQTTGSKLMPSQALQKKQHRPRQDCHLLMATDRYCRSYHKVTHSQACKAPGVAVHTKGP